jgi:hypothetical protein
MRWWVRRGASCDVTMSTMLVAWRDGGAYEVTNVELCVDLLSLYVLTKCY